jgi:ribosomal protein S12 methylthiotransferase
LGERVGMVSLGCAKNQVDAEVMLGLLSEAGYEIVNRSENAHIIIVNTCGFIESAKEESIDAILEQAQYKKDGQCRLLIVTGCLAQRYYKQLIDEMPEVDAIVGTGHFTEIVDIIRESSEKNKPPVRIEGLNLPLRETAARVLTTPPYTAYLKISEGCNNYCTYCVIPQLRGRHRSRPLDGLLKEAEELVAGGVRELILVGQDLTRYGQDLDGQLSLVKLLKELVKIPELVWIRLLYCYPDRVTDELIDTVAQEEKICKYMDIPLQHIHPSILKRMNRHFAPEEIRNLLLKVRNRIPGIILRTSFIVGFPGEDEDEFRQLLDFAQEFPFNRLGVFTYSREEGTLAAGYPHQVDREVKEARRAALMGIQQKISKELNQRRVGEVCHVLIERDNPQGIYTGRSYGEAPEIDGQIFVISQKPLHVGEFVKVRITKAYEYDLLGETYEFSK